MSAPEPSAELAAALSLDADQYRWAAAVVKSTSAAGYQLAIDAPVLALGGFNGTDPAPTLEQFQRYVEEGDVHYFIGSESARGFGNRAAQSGSRAAADIADWVQTNYEPQLIDGVAVYDLSEPRRDS